VLRRLAARFPDRYPLLLDSAASGPLSRASVLLAEPEAALWLGADGRLGAQGFVPQGTSFLAALENWWLTERSAPLANSPSNFAISDQPLRHVTSGPNVSSAESCRGAAAVDHDEITSLRLSSAQTSRSVDARTAGLTIRLSGNT